MKKLRFMALLTAALLACAALAGCTTGSLAAASQPAATQATVEPTLEPTPIPPENVTLMLAWWGNDARHAATNAAVDFWNKAHPETQVQTSPQGWDGYADKLLTQLAAGTAPDVFQISTNNITDFADKGQLLDLTPYMDTQFVDYDAVLKKLYTVDGKNYSLSTGINVPCLMYNKTLLDKLGIAAPTDDETFDSLLELCKKATKDMDGDGKTDVWGMSIPLYGLDFMYQLGVQYGTPIFSEDGKSSNFSDPNLLSVFKMLDGFMQAGVCPGPGDVTVKEGSSAFISGYTAFDFSALSAYGGSVGASADELNVVAFPIVAGKPEMRYVTGSVPMTVYSKGAHPDRAVQFLSWFLTSADSATAQNGMVRGVFPSKAQRDAMAAKAESDRIMAQSMRVANFFGSLDTAGVQPPTPLNIEEWTKLYSDTCDEYAYKQLTIEQFCQKLKDQGDPILAK